MEREYERQARAARRLADGLHVRRVVVHLEIDQIHEAAGAHAAIKLDHLLFADRDLLAALARMTPREQDRDATRRGLQSACRVDHLPRVVNALEEIDAPFDEV